MTDPADSTGSGSSSGSTGSTGSTGSAGRARARAAAELHAVRAGALTTVQDLGRPGHAHLGVPRSGALDEPAHRLANRLLGNPENAATLETTLDGCAVLVTAGGQGRSGPPPADPKVTAGGETSRGPVTEAVVTGAPCAVTVDGRPAPWGVPFRLAAGAVLDVGPAERGLRSYIAFSGGVDAEPVLGSRATDLLSGLGPEPLRDGARLPLGATSAAGPRHGAAIDTAPWAGPPGELVLPVVPGPRADWFTGEALRTLLTGGYRVSSASNRIGLRLEGPVLERAREGELPSEGIALGALQVPPEGRPVVFLADHPVTGGYPVIGVVPQEALAAVAQAVPGTPVRFTPVSG
ncbi:biotin-dependent carboxyltransferase family protein [Streptomyces bathyalis]|uniref:Biotin-dependent carboxyltransferase family protein n=1 Tax=Streptomyces bathyalis TaxID=2710756 RepID=A0A7T1T9W3_9ACTN|nr:biotin-dependent carboxyltransferase family protein [Streptomyces bathyalis]QPP09091.1 biotin-dependent carboxyltransferase family protein [Streptomyces bathyalis]